MWRISFLIFSYCFVQEIKHTVTPHFKFFPVVVNKFFSLILKKVGVDFFKLVSSRLFDLVEGCEANLFNPVLSLPPIIEVPKVSNT